MGICKERQSSTIMKWLRGPALSCMPCSFCWYVFPRLPPLSKLTSATISPNVSPAPSPKARCLGLMAVSCLAQPLRSRQFTVYVSPSRSRGPCVQPPQSPRAASILLPSLTQRVVATLSSTLAVRMPARMDGRVFPRLFARLFASGRKGTWVETCFLTRAISSSSPASGPPSPCPPPLLTSHPQPHPTRAGMQPTTFAHPSS